MHHQVNLYIGALVITIAGALASFAILHVAERADAFLHTDDAYYAQSQPY